MFRKTGTFLIALVAAGLFYAAFPVASARAEEGVRAAPALPVPRFVTLATDEINLRTGPGLRYPIRLVVKKDGLPVEVIREFDVWRQVRDVEGDEGWVHKSMLSGKRAVLVQGGMRTLVKNPDGGKALARVEPGVIAALKSCRGEWCAVSVASYDGWMKRAEIWGVYPDETFGKD